VFNCSRHIWCSLGALAIGVISAHYFFSPPLIAFAVIYSVATFVILFWKRRITTSAGIALLLAIVLTVYYVGSTWGLIPSRFDTLQAEKIASLIESGGFAQDPTGVVELPVEYAGATVDGKVYVTNLQMGPVYLFKMSLGHGQNFSGHLFTRIPFAQLPILKDEFDRDSIEVNGYFDRWAVQGHNRDFQQISAEIEPAKTPSWYRVWRDSD
jgi:hypothetical protein